MRLSVGSPAGLFAACLLLLLLALPRGGLSLETVILEVVLNGEPKGEFFVQRGADGDVLMATGDLVALEITVPPGEEIEAAGETLRSLLAMPETTFTVDEKSLTLHITVAPSMLPRTTIDFTEARNHKVYQPRDASAFVNYGLDLQDLGPQGGSGLNFSNQIGVRRGNSLFLTESLYASGAERSAFVRLMTTLTTDRREDLVRWTVGDTFASSGDLGGRVVLGGFSYAKRYRLDPYVLKHPTLGFSGSVAAPTEVDVYIDGARVRTEQLPPGEFDLVNINRHGGAGLLELVLRDPYGNEERLRHPFYLAEQLLKEGLHEYSYNLGLLRNAFGIESFDYGEPVFSAFHRYGRSDTLTLGVSAEAGKSIVNIAPDLTWRSGAAGIVRATLASHFGGEGMGYAGTLGYSYLGRRFSVRLGLSQYSPTYSNLATTGRSDRPAHEYSAAVSYGTRKLGSFSVELAAGADHGGGDRQSLGLTFSRNLRKDLSCFTTLRQGTESGASVTTLLFMFNYHPWKTRQLSSRIEVRDQNNSQSLHLLKNPPLGEGYGYQAFLERSSAPEASNTLGGNVQYNTRHGVHRAELQAVTGADGGLRYRLGTSGAVTRVGGRTTFTRPVTDSFGVVKLGDLEGVRVYHNSQEMGRTDASGMVFLPNLNSYYENQISIESKDVPLDYSLTSVTRFVAPPLRSGSCITFDAEKFQPVTGRVAFEKDGEVLPLEFAELLLTFSGRQARVPTGKGGEFYLDPLELGGEAGVREDGGCTELLQKKAASAPISELQGQIAFAGEEHAFRIDLPPSDELFVDLGTIIVNRPPAPVAPQGEADR